jgi:signal transduction histidine kinase
MPFLFKINKRGEESFVMKKMQSPHRILVVDDEEKIRKSLSGLLHDNGYDVMTAGSGSECLEILSSQHIDLVILDIVMPEMSGIDVLKKIKEKNKDTEVIMISGYADKEKAIAIFRLNAYDLIEKPFESKEMLNTISHCLNHLGLREETEKKNQELKELESQICHAQKMEAIGTLTGGIAHEFNNLLTTIIGYGKLLQEEMNKDPLQHYIDRILASSERASELVKSLLAFSREQIIDPRPVKLNGIIKGVEIFLMKVIGEDIGLMTTFKDEDVIVMVDSVQIEQVLINLATNARDAMPDGGRLTISTELVELDGKYLKTNNYVEAGKYALISVMDTGAGMDDKAKERIFEPFFTTKEFGKGTGLGLSIVYRIIEQHNGYINVYSKIGEGTEFKIYLPVNKSSIEEIRHADITSPTGGTETILLAEDNEKVRKFTKKILQKLGYKVLEAVDGEDAINKFIEDKDKIQLLIFDLIMPKKNGKKAYEEIRKVRPDIEVLFTSGYTGNIIQKKGSMKASLILSQNQFL